MTLPGDHKRRKANPPKDSPVLCHFLTANSPEDTPWFDNEKAALRVLLLALPLSTLQHKRLLPKLKDQRNTWLMFSLGTVANNVHSWRKLSSHVTGVHLWRRMPGFFSRKPQGCYKSFFWWQNVIPCLIKKWLQHHGNTFQILRHWGVLRCLYFILTAQLRKWSFGSLSRKERKTLPEPQLSLASPCHSLGTHYESFWQGTNPIFLTPQA